ncbi:MAG: AraC family transcriptional regulator [Planctomycetota bacterium]|nr:AraC family transcriptional regulator [Planctomycetota bacterium]
MPDLEIRQVVVALYQEKGSRYRFRGERHAGLWEIFCLDRGKAFVRVGTRRFRARPGDCFLYAPGAFHQHQATQGHAPHYYTIAFTARGAGCLKELCGRAWSLPGPARALLPRIVAEAGQDPGAATLRRALLAQFLVEWLRAARGNEASKPAPPRETYHENTARRAVARALEYLSENLKGRLSLEAAARAAGVSPPYLRELARAQLGHSLREELKRRRVALARHLLSHGTGNVKEIAAAVGYENVSAFTRAFRAVEGLSPRAYARTVAARGPTPLPEWYGRPQREKAGNSES